MPLIPTSYEEWEHCITVECKIPLTLEFVEQRIKSLQDNGDFYTQKFIGSWGEAHHAKTLSWFQEAQKRLSQ